MVPKREKEVFPSRDPVNGMTATSGGDRRNDHEPLPQGFILYHYEIESQDHAVQNEVVHSQPHQGGTGHCSGTEKDVRGHLDHRQRHDDTQQRKRQFLSQPCALPQAKAQENSEKQQHVPAVQNYRVGPFTLPRGPAPQWHAFSQNTICSTPQGAKTGETASLSRPPGLDLPLPETQHAVGAKRQLNQFPPLAALFIQNTSKGIDLIRRDLLQRTLTCLRAEIDKLLESVGGICRPMYSNLSIESLSLTQGPRGAVCGCTRRLSERLPQEPDHVPVCRTPLLSIAGLPGPHLRR